MEEKKEEQDQELIEEMREHIFDEAFKDLLTKEGGYVNDPDDKGGETNWGISKRRYPKLDIKNLSLQRAKQIYYEDYWKNSPFKDIYVVNIRKKLFDMEVNLGQKAAVVILQRALRALFFDLDDDGIYGPMTQAAVGNCYKTREAGELIVALRCEQAAAYRVISAKNPTQKKFLRGWLNRAYG